MTDYTELKEAAENVSRAINLKNLVVRSMPFGDLIDDETRQVHATLADKSIAYDVAMLLKKAPALLAENERLREACRHITPYLKFTISDESPGHHPTMPSAVADFLAKTALGE